MEGDVNMFRPTLEEVKKYAEDSSTAYKAVPVMKEILSDIRTPMEVLKRLLKVSKHTYMHRRKAEDLEWYDYRDRND